VVEPCAATVFCSLMFFFNKNSKKIYNATAKRKITYTNEGRRRSGNEKQEG
jgi:hypothetical protein